MTALVYNVMYSTSKVLSFGTGQFAMAGGICTAWLVLDLHLPLWLGLLACIASGAVFGWLSELIAVRRIVAASDEHLWVLEHAGPGHHGAGGDGHRLGHRPDAVPARLPAGIRRQLRPEVLAAADLRGAHGGGTRAVLPPLDDRQAVHRDVRGQFRGARPRCRNRPDAVAELRSCRRVGRAVGLHGRATDVRRLFAREPRSGWPASSRWRWAASAVRSARWWAGPSWAC